jgi:hypothetical protein
MSSARDTERDVSHLWMEESIDYRLSEENNRCGEGEGEVRNKKAEPTSNLGQSKQPRLP